MKINKRMIDYRDGTQNTIYEMTTRRGLAVSVMTLGAAIRTVTVRDDNGTVLPIALGFEDPARYQDNPCYAGVTLGPNAGRIRGSALPAGDHCLPLTSNDGPHQLHGGPHSLSGQLWQTESAECRIDSASILLSATQPDGLDGYPGNRVYHARYTLEDTGWLTIEYRAVTDRPTYINMSSHTYWNLSGDFTKSALEQHLTIAANNVCINDPEHLPTDIIPVTGTAFDFTKSRTICTAISAADGISRAQLDNSNGYNNAYILSKNETYRSLRTARRPQSLSSACILTDNPSGRTLKLYTDAPALVLYTGGYIPEGLPLLGGATSTPSCAIALEAQDLPDIMHLLPEYYQLTVPEQPFQRTIRCHIS